MYGVVDLIYKNCRQREVRVKFGDGTES